MLAFVPLGHRLVPVPGELTLHGQQPKRVCAHVRGGQWVMSGNPMQCEPGTQLAQGLVRMAQRGDLAPADAATAAACGVPFQPVEFVSPAAGWKAVQADSPKPSDDTGGSGKPESAQQTTAPKSRLAPAKE